MPPVDSRELKERIAKAKDLIAIAEQKLDTALKELQTSERSNKTMITNVLREAFDELEAAKNNLEAVVEQGEH